MEKFLIQGRCQPASQPINQMFHFSGRSFFQRTRASTSQTHQIARDCPKRHVLARPVSILFIFTEDKVLNVSDN